MIILIYIIIGFIAGSALTWLSMANMIDSSHQAGYVKGFHDAKMGVKDAE